MIYDQTQSERSDKNPIELTVLSLSHQFKITEKCEATHNRKRVNHNESVCRCRNKRKEEKKIVEWPQLYNKILLRIIFLAMKLYARVQSALLMILFSTQTQWNFHTARNEEGKISFAFNQTIWWPYPAVIFLSVSFSLRLAFMRLIFRCLNHLAEEKCFGRERSHKLVHQQTPWLAQLASFELWPLAALIRIDRRVERLQECASRSSSWMQPNLPHSTENTHNLLLELFASP